MSDALTVGTRAEVVEQRLLERGSSEWLPTGTTGVVAEVHRTTVKLELGPKTFAWYPLEQVRRI